MNICIVGATKGLGLSLTKKFLEEGHTVFSIALEPSLELDNLISTFKGNLEVCFGDITNENFVKDACELCGKYLVNIDSLCNVVGVLLHGDRSNLLHNCDIDELRRTFEVNTIAPVIIVKYFYPLMKINSTMLTVTSEGIEIKSCGTWVPCYGMSKASATKISGIMNASVTNVDFYSVHPGRMNTDMGKTTAQIQPEESAEGFYSIMTGKTPISRNNWYIDYMGNVL